MVSGEVEPLQERNDCISSNIRDSANPMQRINTRLSSTAVSVENPHLDEIADLKDEASIRSRNPYQWNSSSSSDNGADNIYMSSSESDKENRLFKNKSKCNGIQRNGDALDPQFRDPWREIQSIEKSDKTLLGDGSASAVYGRYMIQQMWTMMARAQHILPLICNQIDRDAENGAIEESFNYRDSKHVPCQRVPVWKDSDSDKDISGSSRASTLPIISEEDENPLNVHPSSSLWDAEKEACRADDDEKKFSRSRLNSGSGRKSLTKSPSSEDRSEMKIIEDELFCMVLDLRAIPVWLQGSLIDLTWLKKTCSSLWPDCLKAAQTCNVVLAYAMAVSKHKRLEFNFYLSESIFAMISELPQVSLQCSLPLLVELVFAEIADALLYRIESRNDEAKEETDQLVGRLLNIYVWRDFQPGRWKSEQAQVCALEYVEQCASTRRQKVLKVNNYRQSLIQLQFRNDIFVDQMDWNTLRKRIHRRARKKLKKWIKACVELLEDSKTKANEIEEPSSTVSQELHSAASDLTFWRETSPILINNRTKPLTRHSMPASIPANNERHIHDLEALGIGENYSDRPYFSRNSDDSMLEFIKNINSKIDDLESKVENHFEILLNKQKSFHELLNQDKSRSDIRITSREPLIEKLSNSVVNDYAEKRAASVARPWTLEEEIELCLMIREFGNKWSEIRKAQLLRDGILKSRSAADIRAKARNLKEKYESKGEIDALEQFTPNWTLVNSSR